MLETNRLTIRKFQEKDSSDLYEYLSLPETYVFEPGNPLTYDEAKKLAIERSQGNNFYVVVLREEGKMIGHLYFNQIEPKHFLTWELGYIFNPKFHNRGYATEASGELIKYAFNELKAHRIVAYCNPKNIASWKLLEKIGMRREGHFLKKAFFRRDKENKPIWHDCYAYAKLEG